MRTNKLWIAVLLVMIFAGVGFGSAAQAAEKTPIVPLFT